MRIGYIIFLLELCVLLPAVSHAEDNVYQIGVEDIPYLPYYETKEKEYRGFVKDLFDLFANDQHIKFEYVPLPVKRLYREFLDEKVDFKFPDNIRWSGDSKKGHKIYYSEGIVEYVDGVLVLPKHLNKMKKLKKLGTVRGFTPWIYIDEINAQKIENIENSNLISVIKQGVLGRVDGVFVNIAAAKFLMLNEFKNPTALVFEKSLPYTKDKYALSTKKHPELLKKLNKWMDKNKELKNNLKRSWKIDLEDIL